MESDPRPQLTVLTLLYDPVGSGLDLFRRCESSVTGQRGVDLSWTISVSAAAPAYDPVLQSIEGNGYGVVHRQSGVTELGQHLAVALPLVDGAATHILCHDDSYTGPGSAAAIARALDVAPAVSIEPIGWTPGQLADFADPRPGAVLLRPESAGARRRESWGVNRTGGLSTVAWVGGAEVITADPRYSLLADLALREQLRARMAGLQVLEGGLVREARWPGQSQFALAGRAREETRAWMTDNGRPAATARLIPLLATGARWRSRLLERG